MKRLLMFGLIAGLAIFGSFGYAYQGEQEEDVRGAFLTSRPKTTEKPATARPKAVRRRPKTTVSGSMAVSGTSSSKSGTTSGTASVSGSATTSHVTTTPTPRKLGMGLTLFMRDASGLAIRVDPSHEFHKNDRVRLLLETNADGFLYVFNTTNGGRPVMIYPDPDLDDAGNYIQAHVPVEVPTSVAAEERLKWFRFDENAGTERLYFIFTRDALPGIPLEDDLIAFCKEKNTNCPMQPSDEVWARIQKDLSAPVKNSKSQSFGAQQTSHEQQATTRGIGLSKEDPEPSVVLMTTMSNTNTLVTTLDLIHK